MFCLFVNTHGSALLSAPCRACTIVTAGCERRSRHKIDARACEYAQLVVQCRHEQVHEAQRDSGIPHVAGEESSDGGVLHVRIRHKEVKVVQVDFHTIGGRNRCQYAL